MDQSVLDALQRWPNVPAVTGWLSLSARGAWRLHPLGDAQQGGMGEGITNTQILGFMNRNYACEPDGRWFFQNGPQRVYVRLDAAPFILHLRPDQGEVVTHNDVIVKQVNAWFADEQGQLYATTDLGPARMDDRDLLALSDILSTPTGSTLLDALENPNSSVQITLLDRSARFQALANAAPLTFIRQDNACALLGFNTLKSAS
ncbi:DUF2946 family protein [Orrella sp. NBD-18]|uniref:DUF2946 family protein n=1 Tax=Sheuella amnicola TaxID=2707330 RepID=A0A6B2R114_9BURK|nr:DUF2946 family protein [Sheuella amnicola]NDY84456.1 DUF2946 family protein [Sheuella amnicola]HBI83633.1 DUF2946 domain-containing protein [Alcaligenaceae bacterium]